MYMYIHYGCDKIKQYFIQLICSERGTKNKSTGKKG